MAALALLITLSSCNNKKTATTDPVSAWDAIVHIHPDYFLEEKPCQDSSASFPWCTEKRVIIQNGKNIYVRAELDSNGAPILYVGSHNEKDTIESEMGNGVLEIQSQ